MKTMFAGIFRSFGYAFRGVLRTVREERNFRIHLVAVCLVTWFSFLYEVSWGQAALLCIVCSAVLSLELMNTALEHAVDLISPQYSPLAERAKDAAAGGVLLSAIASVITAVFLFRDGDHWALVLEKIKSPVRILCFVLFVVAALLFVRGRNPKKKKNT